MKRILSILAAGFVLMSCTTYSGLTLAGEQPNLLIMGEDVDRDTVPRNSRVFKRVLNALANQLHDEGFNVFDETAVSMDDFVPGRFRRTDNEIIDVARSINRPPVDVAVIFSIYASSQQMDYTTRIRARIEGRMLNVRSGQRLGNFEVEIPRAINAPHDCNRECLLETVGKQARTLSQDLGAVLTEKLAHMADGGSNIAYNRRSGYIPTAYTLRFNGFDARDIDGIEEYIVAFSGYRHHRPIRTNMRHAEYWYETDIESARLNRNLRRMLDHLGVRGRVVFAGNTFTVDRINLRKSR